MSSFSPLQLSISSPPPNSNLMAQALPHPVMYPTSQQQQIHYLSQYYSTPYAQYGPSSYPERTLKTERRRPKYTRSKTGCLTCRKKKVKCDETKPACQRCSNSQLSCTWPEVPPPKKKGPSRKGRTPADQVDSAATSEAGTSSVSPTDTTHMDVTPQTSFKSEAPSPEIQQEGASCASSLAFTDPNMLHVGNGLNNDRRHSEPHLVPSFAATSASEPRRRSMADITDGQEYLHHNSRQEHHYQHNDQSAGASNGANGALGLSLNQLGANTRPSTPSDFFYPHARAQGSQASSGFLGGFSPSSGVSIIPNISTGSTSSRPSTSASSLSLSHSLRRAPANSRPSTAGSYVGAGASASISGHQQFVHHRPASSCSGSGSNANDYSSLGLSPFSFQLGRSSADVSSLDGTSASAMSGYTSACVSRPSSSANSVPSAAPSPYMQQQQHGGVAMDGSGGVGGLDRWHSPPLLGQSTLAQPQPQAIVGNGLSGYFQQMSSPALHSRTHSPAWAC